MTRMVAFLGLGCSVALAGATSEQENALSLVQMMVQKQLGNMPAYDASQDRKILEPKEGETEEQFLRRVVQAKEETAAGFAATEASGEKDDETFQQQADWETKHDWEVADKASGEKDDETLEPQADWETKHDWEVADSETKASIVASASHWGSPGTCKVTDDTFFSIFDGAKEMSLLQADIDTDTDTNTDSGFRLNDFLKDGEAKDLWLVRGRAHDGSTVRVAARYWRNASSTGHQVFLKSLAISGGFITNRTLIVRPMQDHITWNNKKEAYAILQNEESAFSIAGLVNATRKASTSGSTVEVQLPKEMKLIITRHQKYVDVAISMPPLATQDGLCGNFNGDSSDDSLGMILSRGPRVKDEHNLFPAEWVPAKAAPAQLAGEVFAESRNEVVLDMD